MNLKLPDWLATRLVDDAHNVCKWWSTRLTALWVLLVGVFASAPILPPQIQALIPNPEMQVKLAGLWALASMVARVIKQPSLPTK